MQVPLRLPEMLLARDLPLLLPDCSSTDAHSALADTPQAARVAGPAAAAPAGRCSRCHLHRPAKRASGRRQALSQRPSGPEGARDQGCHEKLRTQRRIQAQRPSDAMRAPAAFRYQTVPPTRGGVGDHLPRAHTMRMLAAPSHLASRMHLNEDALGRTAQQGLEASPQTPGGRR